jgi:hypothetical protein
MRHLKGNSPVTMQENENIAELKIDCGDRKEGATQSELLSRQGIKSPALDTKDAAVWAVGASSLKELPSTAFEPAAASALS